MLFSSQQKFVVDNLLENDIPNDEIMVLTPYRAQIDCCMKENIVQPVEITTIHGSQGQYTCIPKGVGVIILLMLMCCYRSRV